MTDDAGIRVAEVNAGRLGDALHPGLAPGNHFGSRGGEYLPVLKANEVEIARINLNSTNFDVTAVYARRLGRRIAYRVVDEYEGETLSEPSRRTSMRPLTMGRLIDFCLGACGLFECLEACFEGEPERMLEFFWAESEFYPRLDETLSAMVEGRYSGSEEDDEEGASREGHRGTARP